MRLSSICSEAWRNLTCGTAKLALMVVITAVLGLLMGGYEAATISTLQNQARTRVQAHADVKMLLGEHVDGVTCERLTQASGGPSSSGAFRKGPQITPLATPGMDLASFQITSGLLSILSTDPSVKVDPSGTWVSSDLARDFGLNVGSVLPTDHGDAHIAGIFDWPNDGRDTRLAYALVTPVAASDGSFQECWAQQWPLSPDLDALMKVAQPVGGADSKGAATTLLNKGFDSHYDGLASYRARLTRWMPYLAVVVGIFMGVWSVIRRRLEYAGALHSGQDKGSQLLTVALETVIWLLLGTAAAVGGLVALVYLTAPADQELIVLTALRSPVGLLAGTLIGALGAALSIRQSQLFRYFKNR
ncbi:hypothetical protein KIMH_12700 [Bombiscardovia apis]|uniref:ABC transporter ATP-binding protein n=1 Tax=Bombiscardovia apis TaxID=2932182 RepID=A0ABN6SGN4_9BIFI|nr:hypothetical protein [Bombiscardovia apis]BDR55159.1 hypothetical protein KIMH_12700 [Bombiscardovia apis]